MKTIFLTGGDGFVGKNIIKKLRNKYKILAPSRIELDLLNSTQLDNFFSSNKIDIIIHCANIGGARKGNNNNVLESNLKMFENILSNKKDYQKLIQLGSGAEYDKSNQIIKVKESQLDLANPSDEYGLSKLEIYHKIKTITNAVSLKIFGLYGPYEDYEYKFISNAIVKSLLNIPIKIVQNVLFDYVYIDDFIKILEWFIENNWQYDCYNIGTNKPISILELAKIIQNNINPDLKIALINQGFNKEYTCDSLRLIEETNCTFTSHEQAIKELIEYYKSIINNIDKNRIVSDEFVSKITINEKK